jgi:glycosyltransferase involved in cell wall biosynthesis
MNDRVSGHAPDPLARGSISVCIPVYNCADVLERALRSVEAQTLPALEVIAVDDGSTDETPHLLERLQQEGRLIAVRQPNGGASRARNTAIRHARGEWIAPLDADDELDPFALERARAAVDRTPSAAWCVCDLLRVGAEGEQVFTTTTPQGPTSGWLVPMLEHNFVERTILLRRKMLLEVGGYDEALRCYEDWELNIRMLKAGVIAAYAPGPLYRYIKTEKSITSDLERLLCAYGQLYERHHRPLADTGDPLFRRMYARQMWALGREYLDNLHDPRSALGCLLASLRYDFAPGRFLRRVRDRMLRTAADRRDPPPAEPDDDAPPVVR